MPSHQLWKVLVMLSVLFFLLEGHEVPSQPTALVPPALPALLSVPGGQFTAPALTGHHSQESMSKTTTVPSPGLKKAPVLGAQQDGVVFVWRSPHYKTQAG